MLKTANPACSSSCLKESSKSINSALSGSSAAKAWRTVLPMRRSAPSGDG